MFKRSFLHILASLSLILTACVAPLPGLPIRIVFVAVVIALIAGWLVWSTSAAFNEAAALGDGEEDPPLRQLQGHARGA